MQTIIRLYQAEDSQVFILPPWSSTSPVKPLDDPANLPLKPEDLKVFANGLKNNISWNSVAWFSLHFTYGEDGPCLDNFPSFGTHTTWFSENKQNAYNHALHDSEREVNIGFFRFTGNFIDIPCLANASMPPAEATARLFKDPLLPLSRWASRRLPFSLPLPLQPN
jgi:hypothetical protein